MNKLDLSVKVLLQELETSEDKEVTLKASFKSFAADVLNLGQYLREKNIEQETARDLIETTGMDYNLKTRKFS